MVFDDVTDKLWKCLFTLQEYIDFMFQKKKESQLYFLTKGYCRFHRERLRPGYDEARVRGHDIKNEKKKKKQ